METQKWRKSVLKLETDRRGMGETTSRQQLGLEYTWSANRFSTYWRQAISMAHAREQAESVILAIGKSQLPVGERGNNANGSA